MLAESDISKEEMYHHGYKAAMRELKKREEIPLPFLDDLSFTDLWAKLESEVYANYNCSPQ